MFPKYSYAAAAAKLLQSCPTLCDPTDSSPSGSPIPGILQARTLEWVAISFSNTEALIPSVLVFGHRAFETQLGHEGGALMMAFVPLRDAKEVISVLA